MKKFSLLIATPSTHLWEAKFGMSMIFMANYLAAHPIPGVQEMSYEVRNKNGSILAAMRQKFIEQALAEDRTHVLFVDSDQTFPRDTVHRLVAHNKGVVACNIATKGVPSYPTARQYSRSKYAGELVYTDEQSTGLERVWRIGTGVMLINMRIFKRETMPPRPWFPQRWNEEIEDTTGEDWAFCEILEKAGVNIYIDHDLSKEIGHIGPFSYDHSLTLLSRDS